MGLERINELKKIKGLTNKRLSELTGISISSLDKITSGENVNPKQETLKQICRALECSINDITGDLTGKEQIIFSEKMMIRKYRLLDSHGKRMVDYTLNEEYNRCIEEQEDEEDDDEEKLIQIKHSYYKVSAGLGFDLQEGDEWEEIDVPDTSETRRADFALTIQGDSMEPVYFDGDIVLVKKQNTIDIGQIGIFILGGAGYIKKFGGDRLISLNDKYNDIVLNEYEECRCAGKVIGRV